MGAVHATRKSGEWHLPAVPGFPSKWCQRQFPGCASRSFGKSFGSKRLRQYQMTAIMLASGGRVGRERAGNGRADRLMNGV
jgi:hypothetical protein